MWLIILLASERPNLAGQPPEERSDGSAQAMCRKCTWRDMRGRGHVANRVLIEEDTIDKEELR